MDNLALELIDYMKDEADQNQETKDLYKSMMYALEDMEYLSKLPEKFQKQEVVEDAWEIARCREMALSPDHFIEDLLPKCLADVIGVDAASYFSFLVNSEMYNRVDEVFNEQDVNRIESESIDTIIDLLFHDNAWKICKDYTKTMKDEFNEIYSISIGTSSANPAVITHYKCGKKFDAVLDREKIEEIYNCYWGDYDTIKFDWKVRS